MILFAGWPYELCTWALRVGKRGCCAGKSMYESDDIVKYLFSNYGDGQVPWGLSLGLFTTLSCGLALIPRCELPANSGFREP